MIEKRSYTPVEVLLVGGPEVFQDLLTGILEDEGHGVCALPTAPEALDYLDCTSTLPDVVLLDVDGPGRGSSSLIDRLTQSGTPIIILSSENDAPQRAQELGFAAGFVKPVQVPDLLNRVRTCAG